MKKTNENRKKFHGMNRHTKDEKRRLAFEKRNDKKEKNMVRYGADSGAALVVEKTSEWNRRFVAAFLALVFAISCLVVGVNFAGRAEDVANLSPAATSGNGLHLEKYLTPNADGTYKLTMDAWATGEIKDVVEQVPTDFVLIVDQSGSMANTDMPTGTFTHAGTGGWNISQLSDDELLAQYGAQYVKVKVNADGTETLVTEAQSQQDPDATYKYYRIYRKRGYMYEYFPGGDSLYSGDMIPEGAAHLFVNDDITQTGSSAYYVWTGEEYSQLFVNIAAGTLCYNLNFSYKDKSGNTVPITRPDQPWYKPWGNIGETIKPGNGIISKRYYEAVNGVVSALATEGSYTYGQFNILFTTVKTGMYLDFNVYKRHNGYNELAYKDDDGNEHTLVSAEFCDSSGNPIYLFDDNHQDYSSVTFDGSLYNPGGTESRLRSLNTAAKAFVDNVSSQKNVDVNGNETPVDHRVSIVGFASDGYNNTEILSGVSITENDNFGRDVINTSTGKVTSSSGGYSLTSESTTSGNTQTISYKGFDGTQYSSGLSSEVYRQSLVQAGTSSGKENLYNAVDAITAYGGTRAQDGFAMAAKVLESRSEGDKQYSKADGTTGERNTVVIFFTDGRPGLNDGSDQYKYANETVANAKTVKDLGATVYSIGVFGESDGNALTYPKYKLTNYRYGVSGTDGNYIYDDDYSNSLEFYSYDATFVENSKNLTTSGSYEYTDVLYRVWNPYESGYGTPATDTIADYMRTVSSEYPSAEEFMDESWYKSEPENRTGTYTDMVANVRKAHDAAHRYYYMASNTEALTNIFTSISSSVSTASSSVQLNSDNSKLLDYISDGFQVVDGASASAKVFQGTADADGNVSAWTDDTDNTSPTPTATITGKNVSATGFDCSANYIAPGRTGKKLSVTIDKVVPTNNTSGLLYSNTNASGLYKLEDSTEKIVAAFPKPSISRHSYTLEVTGENISGASFTVSTDLVGGAGSLDEVILVKPNGTRVKYLSATAADKVFSMSNDNTFYFENVPDGYRIQTSIKATDTDYTYTWQDATGQPVLYTNSPTDNNYSYVNSTMTIDSVANNRTVTINEVTTGEFADMTRAFKIGLGLTKGGSPWGGTVNAVIAGQNKTLTFVNGALNDASAQKVALSNSQTMTLDVPAGAVLTLTPEDAPLYSEGVKYKIGNAQEVNPGASTTIDQNGIVFTVTYTRDGVTDTGLSDGTRAVSVVLYVLAGIAILSAGAGAAYVYRRKRLTTER